MDKQKRFWYWCHGCKKGFSLPEIPERPVINCLVCYRRCWLVYKGYGYRPQDAAKQYKQECESDLILSTMAELGGGHAK